MRAGLEPVFLCQEKTVNNESLEQSHRRSDWHLDKSLSVSHLLTTVGLVVGGMFFVAGQNEQIALNKQATEQNRRDIQMQESRVTKSLDSINSKLDKLHEALIRKQ